MILEQKDGHALFNFWTVFLFVSFTTVYHSIFSSLFMHGSGNEINISLTFKGAFICPLNACYKVRDIS